MESVQDVLLADAEELAKAEGHLNKWLAEYLHERAAVRRMPAVFAREAPASKLQQCVNRWHLWPSPSPHSGAHIGSCYIEE
jgi:hypothetical protein